MTTGKKMLFGILSFLAFLVIAGVVLSSIITVIPPSGITSSAMTASFFRIQIFVREHRRFPASLDELPKSEGKNNRRTDAWGRPLIYRVEKDNFITILSLGEDGLNGGVGEAADISMTYRTKNPDGSWCVDDECWIATARIRNSIGTD